MTNPAMPRRKVRRLVRQEPPVSVFKPAGVPARELETIVLTVDEYEAIRLADSEGLGQRDACEAMRVSQPTFNRILSSGRMKMATALVKGCVLRIEGGHYLLGDGTGTFECAQCGHIMKRSGKNPTSCPKCGSTDLRWIRRRV